MIGHAVGLRRLDGIIWAIIIALAVIMLVAPLASNFQLMGRSFATAGGATALSLAGYWLYQTRRPDPRLASALGGTAQIVAFAAVGAPFSYIAASLDLPLRDSWFDAADRALGLDWTSLLNWMDAHASLHPLFSIIYLSLLPQTVIVVLALALAGRLAWMRVFVLAFMISAIVTIVIAALVPAQGVWGFYKLSPAAYPDIVPATQKYHLPIFLGLRDGSFRQLMAMGSQGIVTFPSLHAALASDHHGGHVANPGASLDRTGNQHADAGVHPGRWRTLLHRRTGGARHRGARDCGRPPHCSVCPSATRTKRRRPNRPGSRQLGVRPF